MSSHSKMLPAILLVLLQASFPEASFSAVSSNGADITAPNTEELASDSGARENSPESDSPDSDTPDSDLGEPLSEEEQARIQQALKNREYYRQVIEQLEIESGGDVYSAEMIEAHMDLGLALYNLEQYEEAIVAFDRALQSVRISNGLNSVQQIPVLQDILTSNESMGDWEAVDAISYLIFHINRKNYPVGDERRIQALNQLGKWTLRAASDDQIGGVETSTADLVELYKNEIRQIDRLDNYDGKNLQLASLYLGEARAKMTFTQEIIERPLTDYMTGQRQTTTSTRCFLLRLPNGRVTRTCESIEVPNIEYYVDPSQRQYQEINRYLNDIKTAITDAYEIAKTELTRAENPEQINSILAEVQQLTTAYNAFISNNTL